MYFDFNSSKFYVAVSGLEIIQVFDINCVLKQNFSLGTNISAYGLNYFNSRFYISTKAANQILVLENGNIIKNYTVSICIPTKLVSITFDSFCYIAI